METSQTRLLETTLHLLKFCFRRTSFLGWWGSMIQGNHFSRCKVRTLKRLAVETMHKLNQVASSLFRLEVRLYSDHVHPAQLPPMYCQCVSSKRCLNT